MRQESFNVLVIDDDPMVAEALGLIISKSLPGCKTTIATSVGDGAFVKEGWKLVVLDLHMPGTNGLEFLRDNQQFVRNSPFILVSTESNPISAMSGLKLGASAFISKW